MIDYSCYKELQFKIITSLYQNKCANTKKDRIGKIDYSYTLKIK